MNKNLEDELITKKAARDALWKALYNYQDKTEKQFRENENLDYDKWFVHRIFVQNMNDEDRKAILNLPAASDRYDNGYADGYKKGHMEGVEEGLAKFTQEKPGKWIWKRDDFYECSVCEHLTRVDELYGEPAYEYCPYCRAKITGFKKY